jgi:hypothetical protein
MPNELLLGVGDAAFAARVGATVGLAAAVAVRAALLVLVAQAAPNHAALNSATAGRPTDAILRDNRALQGIRLAQRYCVQF